MSPPDGPPPPPDQDEPSSPGRRRFLGTAAATIGACAGGLVVLPLVSSVVSPLGRRTVKASTAPADVGAESDFEADRPRHVVIRGQATDGWQTADVELGAAWVTRHADGRWSAFSTICPHLGCAVDTGSGADAFFCPCHSSTFALDGAVRSGPSPRALDALPISVTSGRVLVEFRHYVLNQRAQVES